MLSESRRGGGIGGDGEMYLFRELFTFIYYAVCAWCDAIFYFLPY